MTEERQFDPRRRLLGAVVMVVTAIIVVPMLLQAPARHRARDDILTVTRTGRRLQTVWQPAPPAPAAAAVAPPPPPAPVVTAPVAAAPPPAPAAAAVPSQWLVQVGAYVNAAYAILFMQRLRAQGFPAHVHLVRFAHGHGLVVTVGPYDAPRAQAVRTAIAGRDHVDGLLVPAPPPTG